MDGKTTVIWLTVSATAMVFGLVCIVIFARQFRRQTERRSRCTSTVKGVVSRLIEHDDSDGDTLWSPEFTYTAGGAEHVIRLSTATRPSRWKVGDTAVIRYEPFDPENAYVEGAHGSTIMNIAFIIGGALDFLAGLGCFVYGVMQAL